MQPVLSSQPVKVKVKRREGKPSDSLLITGRHCADEEKEQLKRQQSELGGVLKNIYKNLLRAKTQSSIISEATSNRRAISNRNCDLDHVSSEALAATEMGRSSTYATTGIIEPVVDIASHNQNDSSNARDSVSTNVTNTCYSYCTTNIVEPILDKNSIPRSIDHKSTTSNSTTNIVDTEPLVSGIDVIDPKSDIVKIGYPKRTNGKLTPKSAPITASVTPLDKSNGSSKSVLMRLGKSKSMRVLVNRSPKPHHNMLPSALSTDNLVARESVHSSSSTILAQKPTSEGDEVKKSQSRGVVAQRPMQNEQRRSFEPSLVHEGGNMRVLNRSSLNSSFPGCQTSAPSNVRRSLIPMGDGISRPQLNNRPRSLRGQDFSEKSTQPLGPGSRNIQLVQSESNLQPRQLRPVQANMVQQHTTRSGGSLAGPQLLGGTHVRRCSPDNAQFSQQNFTWAQPDISYPIADLGLSQSVHSSQSHRFQTMPPQQQRRQPLQQHGQSRLPFRQSMSGDALAGSHPTGSSREPCSFQGNLQFSQSNVAWTLPIIARPAAGVRRCQSGPLSQPRRLQTLPPQHYQPHQQPQQQHHQEEHKRRLLQQHSQNYLTFRHSRSGNSLAGSHSTGHPQERIPRENAQFSHQNSSWDMSSIPPPQTAGNCVACPNCRVQIPAAYFVNMLPAQGGHFDRAQSMQSMTVQQNMCPYPGAQRSHPVGSQPRRMGMSSPLTTNIHTLPMRNVIPRQPPTGIQSLNGNPPSLAQIENSRLLPVASISFAPDAKPVHSESQIPLLAGDLDHVVQTIGCPEIPYNSTMKQNPKS